jgi:peptidoglycan L-alanyl-D-glutamate endopeptidase CwlK
MAEFGKRSMDRLATAHPDLQKVMKEAIKDFDFTILYGYRTPEEQKKLYEVGRHLDGDTWQVVGKTVTNLDGTVKKSKHNYNPSLAVDIAPYPIDWEDIDRFKTMVQIVKNAALRVGVSIKCGADWKMRDYPHFELA